jgi:hypothetical protein
MRPRVLVLPALLGLALTGTASDSVDDSSARPRPTFGEELLARARQRLEIEGRAGAAPRAPLAPAEWQAAIDANWGPGLPTARKLEIFDTFWNTIDQYFATFQGIDVDWAALRARYRPEVAAGVSRGRFAAIMNHLSLALRESHTGAFDIRVNFQTPLVPGVPLVNIGPWFFSRFGACATAQDDGSALVHEVSPGHPLGLQPGDRVLGFEGRPWTEIYPELLAAELPLSPYWWGSSPSSYDHVFVASGPTNWHLFETIDVAKYGTGEVQHLSTAPLQAGPVSPMCSEQMEVAGIPDPDVFNGNVVSWGTLPGTRIGYIYVWGWFGDAGPGFAEAIRQLTREQQTDGLIIDFRFNLGGNMFLSNEGLSMLFGYPTPTIGFAVRADPNDHFKMRMAAPPSIYVIPGGPQNTAYDRPIAVLTGPGALSSGDQVALRMTFHPRVRTFGKSTATAFNAPAAVGLDPEWADAVAVADAFLIDKPHDYLTHDEFVVDEPVWLTPADVAAGRDTVVEAAAAWIRAQSP